MTRVAWWVSLAGWLCSHVAAGETAKVAAFRTLQPGVEYAEIVLEARPVAGDGKLHVIRVDPQIAELDLGLASESGARRTASQWGSLQRFSVTINAGMYETDYRSNVGYLVHGDHTNQKRWKGAYQSVLAMDPTEPGFPKAMILDRDSPGFEERAKRYRTLVQNLRLIRGPGINVWKPNKRKWSEAFIAMDSKGRLLFCFTRTPFEMADLMDRVLASELGVTHAMHAEGGPEASFSIHTPDFTVDFCGSYESGFFPRDDNERQWEIPNVIGVRIEKK